MKCLYVSAKMFAIALAFGCATSDAGIISSSAGIVADVPASLNVQAGQEMSLEANATGVQIYECKAKKDDPNGFEWAFKAPKAELFDGAGKNIGKHYAGPTWESNDGSKVVGEVKAKDHGPDPNAIPWLLLSAKSTAGNGVLRRTQSIQRLRTAGGNAPADGCNRGHLGKEIEVPYKAIYRFYVGAQ